jgi:hypothetical protein
MPAEMEAALKRRAKKMGLGKGRTGAFVYGTMRKAGWRPGQGEGTSHEVKPGQGFEHRSEKAPSTPVRRGRNLTPGTPRGSIHPGSPGYKGEGETSGPMKYKAAMARRAQSRYKGPTSPRGTQS